MSSKARSLPRTLIGALFHRWTWIMAWRDSRSQRWRLLLFALAMVAGIAGLVTIHSLKASLEKGIDGQMQALLGSDLMVSSQRAFTETDIQKLSQKSRRYAQEISFPSMVEFANDGARMVNVRATEGEYPFYGKFKTEPAQAHRRLNEGNFILLPPAMLTQYEAKIGDEVQLGEAKFTILGTIAEAAPAANQMSNFAPEAYVSLQRLQITRLLEHNSLLNHVLHLEIPGTGNYKRLKQQVEKEFSSQGWRIQTPEDRRRQIGNSLDHFQRFLGILALASLALGALGVAGAVQSHVNRRVPSIAILQCLGAPRALSSAIYVAQTLVLGCIGALAGSAVGMTLHLYLVQTYRDSIPVEISPQPEWLIAGYSVVTGLLVCLGFAMIPLSKIRQVSPAAAVRVGAQLPTSFWSRLPVYLALAAMLLLMAKSHEGTWLRAGVLVGSLGFAFGLVSGVAKGLTILTRWMLRPSWPYVLRQAVSNLYRPGNQTQLFLVSLGLGTFLILSILMIGEHLRKRLDFSMNVDSPSLYMVDVQEDQMEGVKALLKRMNLPLLESSPIVTMRIQAIKGVPVSEIKDIPKWIGAREFRSTYREQLTRRETLVSGKWHTKNIHPEAFIPLSLEVKLAGDMKVGLGDRVTLDVQGVPLEAQVTSLREVDWSAGTLNFFMVLTPESLEGAPAFHVLTTKTTDPEESGKVQLALMKEFGNITCIDLSQILETVETVLRKIMGVIRMLGSITLLAAIPIVAGTFLNGRDVRLRESLLLRTLGASSRQIRSILCLEFVALGGLSGLTGVLLAIGASTWFGYSLGMGVGAPDWNLCWIALALNVGIALFGGIALSNRASHHSPLELLRRESDQ